MSRFKSILQRIKAIKRDFLAKSPLDKWLFFRQIHIFLLNIIGLAVVESNYKINMLTFIPIFIQIDYYALMFYSMYYYRNEPEIAIRATILLGFFIPGLVLLVLALMPSTRPRLRAIYNFVGDYIFNNSNVSAKTYEVCDRMAIGMVKTTVTVILILATGFSAGGFQPLMETLFSDDRILFVPVIIPCTDPNTANGFYINLGHQIVAGIFGFVIVGVVEIATCVFRNTFVTIAAVIENSILEFNDRLKEHQRFSLKMTLRFRNIIQKILDFYGLNEEISDVIYWGFLLRPVFLTHTITIGIFSYITDRWSAGLGFACACYVQLLVSCEMGKALDDANDNIFMAIDRFPYYLLPLKKQKMFALTLDRIQNGTKIKMGPFSALNFECATKLTKLIYSYVMMMLKATK